MSKHEVIFGKVIEGEAFRDAVHIAVAPVMAAEILAPGQAVELVPGTTDKVRVHRDGNQSVGIVDPFLTRTLFFGERFWLCLYPQTVTGMRHEWTHPAFPPETVPAPDKAASEKWLRNFMDENGLHNFEGMIAVASGQTDRAGEYGDGWRGGSGSLITYGYESGVDIPSEFWDHVEVVTGRKIPHGGRASYFSCSC